MAFSLRSLLPALMASLLLVVAAPRPAAAAPAEAAPQRWVLRDQSDRSWGLTLFSQPDPAYPSGWRLRLSARSPGLAVDHERPLTLQDGMGSAWSLPNRSAELVPWGETGLPAASGQFDAAALEPRPSEALPLRLEVPLDDGASTGITLEPEVVAALHGLPAEAG
ncbi:MAG: DUF3122 domain-containing protein [Synechococcaceae cyanobacterium]|nr:DUF3122 domain-containing protein [Synechococcaceae cyanobacterium]